MPAELERPRVAAPIGGRFGEEAELVDVLKRQISLEKELENAKVELALKPDFNLMDGFRMFDVYARGWVSPAEFADGLRDLGVFFDSADVDLFFKRFEKDRDNLLRYSDFCDAFTPLAQEYSTILSSRGPYFIHRESYRPYEYFHPDTRLALKNALRVHFQVEASAEDLRKKQSRRPFFNVYDAFKMCDFDGRGFITGAELYSLMKYHGFFATDQEIDLLMERYDKNRDGRISYSEVSLRERI